MNFDPKSNPIHHNKPHTKPHLIKQILQPNTPKVKPSIYRPTPNYQPKQSNDYQLQARKTIKFHPFRDTSKKHAFLTENKQITQRMDRQSQSRHTRLSRQNYLINPQESLNNSSRQKLKILSNGRGNQSSRSQNSSVRKLRGIQLTKPKGFTGLYQDKDIQVRQSFTNTSQRSTQGPQINGKVNDQYQLNDYQTPIKVFAGSNHLHADSNRSSNIFNKSSNHQKSINKQTAEQIVARNHFQELTKGKVAQPQRDILKARSYDLLPTKTPTPTRIPIFFNNKPEAPTKPQKRQPQTNIYCSPQPQPLPKRKTIEQLSLKQSLIIEFDPYRR